MYAGMIWYDSDPSKPIETKIREAAARFREKFGSDPRIAEVNTKDAGHVVAVDNIKVVTAHMILANHIWIGCESGERPMKKRMQKIREIVAAATPGPWRVSGNTGDWDVEADLHILGGRTDHMFFRQEDARFVACARNEMPGLLDRVERMAHTIYELDRRLADALACNAAQAEDLERLREALSIFGDSQNWEHEFRFKCDGIVFPWIFAQDVRNGKTIEQAEADSDCPF